jgi:transposase InsO family protein
MKANHCVSVLCETLEVSTSGYYDWRHRQRQPAKRAQQDHQLKEQIRRIHKESHQTYGSPRIQFELSQSGQVHGRNRIARLMRQQKLCGRAKGRFRVRTTDSNHDHPIAPNRLAEGPAPTAANRIWLGDITYIRTGEGWLYLAGVMDRYSRRIVGWAMDQNIDTRLVLAAWEMAQSQRQPAPELVFHSDRGSQYASGDFRQALASSQTQASMSRQGNCYDNAVMEAFWSTLKMELVYRQDFATRRQAREAIFEYIEVFYNRQRRHSALGYKSPSAFENQTN